ncbi:MULTISPECIES: PEGA domain-containing protein [unclassified Oceanispirochaeta]|uniref:PEGA domain-containing protein n=1 Tax=unclassified Oceanispirochaeta TaxID=2635722 RepID=UPI000E08EB6C|nr:MULTISPECIES: PEGA domain-containing protein [unclassified Oceanispirochaeta]MBF9015653.1 PEGA domain-containing protein [Oceanispirochaeta sp. M2]NPD73427.1 PEGA domain-containing protein [Oceanispirochaeta sp. M1]RDG30900.1 PEGA domain-containing protein [Oceanispirochaeta sp. M1]
MIRRFTVIVFLFLTISLFSEPVTLPESLSYDDLKLTKKTWNIGVSSYSGLNLDLRYEYLLNALPLLVHEEISNLSEHILSEDEIVHLQTIFLKEKTIALEKEKSSIHAQRDALLFSELEEGEIKEKYDDYSEKIKEKEELLQFWKDLTIEDIQIEKTLPVHIQKFTDSDARLLSPRVQVQRFMESEDLDLLISGTVEKLDNMFFLNIEGIMQHSGKPVFSLNKVVTEEEINEVVSEGAVELRTVVLGRSWSDLTVTALPSNALLLIDGDSRGVGNMHLYDLEPGFVTLSVISTGFKSDIRQIYLTSGASQSIEIELVKGNSTGLSLFSEPPGADVYFGATWVGQTPLFTEKPGQQSQIKISKNEYMPFYADSDAIDGNSLTVELGADLFDKQKALKISKSKFYRSLGWFSMSIAVPLILSGVYQNLNNRYYNYAMDYNSTFDPASYDKAIEYQKKADIAYYSLWGGVAISGGLLVNTIFKLRDYIRAAEKSTED